MKRRMELLGEFNGIRVFDDFAHHPTAIRLCLDGAREVAEGRVLAVLEPRSNTMKMGVHNDELSAALGQADTVWAYQSDALGWDLAAALSGDNVHIETDVAAIVAGVKAEARPGDCVLIMSNGSFDGIYGLMCEALK